MRILAEIFRTGGVKRQWGCRRRFRKLELRTALLYGDQQSVVGL